MLKYVMRSRPISRLRNAEQTFLFLHKAASDRPETAFERVSTIHIAPPITEGLTITESLSFRLLTVATNIAERPNTENFNKTFLDAWGELNPGK